MSILLIVFTLIFTSIVIYYVGNIFAKASSNIGEYLRLSKSVKGATFDAIASSMPELMVALFSVIFFNSFEVGIGTIVGSALFNLLIIPALCVIVAPIAFKVKDEVVKRDSIFYMFTIFLLLSLVLLFKFWGILISVCLIFSYLIYIKLLIRDTKKHRKEKIVERKKINLFREVVIFIVCVIIMGIATYFLTEASINLSEILGVHAIIIAFTVTAAATSVPDTVISVVNARKGDLDDATSNVFGSNIFDIAIGLGLPLLIYTIGFGSVEIIFEHIELLLMLLGSSIYVLFVMSENNSLSRKQGASLLVIYLFIMIYVFYLAMF